MTELWITILVVGLATYATRAVPLFWRRGVIHRQRPAWLDRLGPCLLAAMAAAVILPDLAIDGTDGRLLPFLLGLVGVWVAMRIARDPGLATLSGMVVYFVSG
jgi:branched-subunit amino acid transport protein